MILNNFFDHMGTLLLNVSHSEPPALVKEMSYFDNMIELYIVPIGAIPLGVHDPLHCILLNETRVEFYRAQVFGHLRGV